MKQALIYSLKVFGTTIIIMAVWIIFLSWYRVNYNPTFFSLSNDYYVGTSWLESDYLRMMGIFLLPFCISFILIVFYFNKRSLKQSRKKIYFTIIGIFFSVIPFAITSRLESFNMFILLPLLISFIAAITLTIWLFNPKLILKTLAD